jgi:hypothetical protein
MVEGLTSSAADQGSAAGREARSRNHLSRSKTIDRRPATSSRVGRSRFHVSHGNPGDSGGEATPVPIPNTEVKLSSAEDTERAAFRENRSSPGLLLFQGLRPVTVASLSLIHRVSRGRGDVRGTVCSAA